MKVVKSPVIFDIHDVMRGEDVQVGTKLYKDAKAFYAQAGELCDDTVMYDVYSYTKGQSKRGNLNWGLTVLHPICVMNECNMTRGHWHEDKECAEFYFGVSGNGLLMLMDEEGNTWCEEVFAGSLHHIDGHLAHRLINTGDEDMKVAACWGCDAGHDYAAVEAMPFGYRVMKENGKLVFVEEKRNEK